MRFSRATALLAAFAWPIVGGPMVAADDAFARLSAVSVVQAGALPAGTETEKRAILASEPDSQPATAVVEFDLGPVRQANTPLARIQFGEVEKLKVVRAEPPGTERGVLHAYVPGPDGSLALAGAMPMKPGGNVNAYMIDVTDAVNAVLGRSGHTKIRFAVQLAGKPLFHEVYALPAARPVLEIASAAGWTDDFEARLAPIAQGPTVYREACFPMAERRDAELGLRLLYPAKRIVEVIRNRTGEKLQPGRDWILRNGRLVLPVGTHAPIELNSEYFVAPRKEKDGTTKMAPTQIRIIEGPWIHQQQIEVTYEPARRDWRWPPPVSSSARLPRFERLIATKAPVKLVLFGDSISVSYNASRFTGVWPYQPGFGELVARKLAQTGSKITFMNHSRGGETSLHATTQADAQVAWFKPDLVILALGMNDRSPERSPAYRANLEKIIDIVRARSPETEFVIVTPMLNNPKQPTGLDPVKFIRDEGLAVARPGVAFVDITSTQLAMDERKDYLDLSGNGVNHPNDFLIRVYAQRILEVLTPAR